MKFHFEVKKEKYDFTFEVNADTYSEALTMAKLWCEEYKYDLVGHMKIDTEQD